MNSRTRVTVVTLSAIAPSIAAGIVAFQMLVIANANQAVPGFLPPLIVAFLLVTVVLFGWAAAMRSKLPSDRQSR